MRVAPLASTLAGAALFLLGPVPAIAQETSADLSGDTVHVFRPTGAAARTQAIPNDHLSPAGRMVDGVLHVRLEAVEAEWYPRGPDGPRITTPAFAEWGKPPQVPGPLVRVSSGTPVLATIRNTLERPIHVRGLSDREAPSTPPPAAAAFLPAFALSQPVVVQPGETREIRFTPTESVSSFYFARLQPAPGGPSPPTIIPGGIADEGAFMGALIVDPPATVSQDDERILMLTRWGSPNEPGSLGRSWKMFVNGRSWPFTERLDYAVCDTVRWRIINASAAAHPMHLHGFYFVVEGVGNTQRDSTLDEATRRDVVTEMMAQYSALRLRWIPDRPGNWLFHCHLIRHSGEPQRFQVERTGDSEHPGHSAVAEDIHDMEGMAGLILGITVRPTGDVHDPVAARRIALWTGSRAGAYGSAPELGFVTQQGAAPPPPDSTVVPGSTNVLTRGEPTEIMIHNRLYFPLSVHWHGLELRSLYDGVGHWSGSPGAVRPSISPGDSQSVVIAAPRAGTFFYHTHGEPGHELAQGLYGALLVLEPDEILDRDTDRVFVLGSRGAEFDAPPVVNGRSWPPAERFERGRTYRLRFIHISPDEFKRVRLLRDGELTTWNLRAKDGAELPASRRVASPAEAGLGVGEAFDFDWTPQSDGAYVLEVRTNYYPSRGGSTVQRIGFGVGDVTDEELRRAAHGDVQPISLSAAQIARYTGTFTDTSVHGGETVLAVWTQDGRLYYSTTTGRSEGRVSYMVPLAADLFAPAAWTDGFVSQVSDEVRLRFSGRDTVHLTEADRAARFVRSDPFMLDSGELHALIGTYGNDTLPTSLEVSLDGSELRLTVAGLSTRLHAISTNRFRLIGDDLPSDALVVFTIEDGKATSLTVSLPAAPPVHVPRRDAPVREDTR